MERWVDGRVALLGGAVRLSHELAARPDDHGAALEAYRRRRVLRTARVQLMSRAVGGHIYRPAGAHAVLRNAIMSAKPDAEWCDTLAWLYGASGLGGGAAAGRPAEAAQ